MRKFRPNLHVAAAALLVLLVAAPVAVQLTRPGAPKPDLPSGLQIFSVAQAEEAWPRILEASIDPLDVYVGDRQVIEVVVESRAQSAEVYADIQTDNDVIRLPLQYVGVAAGEVRDPLADIRPVRSLAVSRAEAGDTFRGRYRGEWIVRDTHNTTYETVITARDGEDESSITMAWTDACGIGMSGDATLSSPCTLTADDGVDNGNVTISSSLTLSSGADFGFNSGRSLTITGSGSIAICSGCQIRQTNVWVNDGDSDSYGYGTSIYLSDSSPGGTAVRKYTVTGVGDCVEAGVMSTLVKPSQAGFFAGEINISGNGSGWDYNCDGVETYEYPDAVVCGAPDKGSCESGVTPGWMNGVPSCGNTDAYATACVLDENGGKGEEMCIPQEAYQLAQACR